MRFNVQLVAFGSDSGIVSGTTIEYVDKSIVVGSPGGQVNISWNPQ